MEIGEHHFLVGIVKEWSYFLKKGQHDACNPAWQGSKKGPSTLGLMYTIFPCIFARCYFQVLTHDLMVTKQQLYRCARAPLQWLYFVKE
jgi:hypothetical protein